MKVTIELDDKIDDTHIVIRTKEINEEIEEIVKILKGIKEGIGLGRYVGIYDEKKYILDIERTVRFYAENKKIYSKYEDGNIYTVNKYLYEIMDDANMFLIRISNSEIANIRYIEHLEGYFGGSIKVVYKNGDTSYISRSYVKMIKKKLGM